MTPDMRSVPVQAVQMLYCTVSFIFDRKSVVYVNIVLYCFVLNNLYVLISLLYFYMLHNEM